MCVPSDERKKRQGGGCGSDGEGTGKTAIRDLSVCNHREKNPHLVTVCVLLGYYTSVTLHRHVKC